jgi:choline kinase
MAKQAIILVAGRNSRLSSVTGNNPKCLLRFSDRRLIDIQINFLKKSGVKRFVIVCGYQSGKIRMYLKKKYPDNNFIFIKNENWAETNVLGSLFCARKFLSAESIILHGDILFSLEIAAKLQRKKTRGAALVVQRKKCGDEEMKFISGSRKKEITFLSKDINPEKAEGEFMGIAKLSEAFGKELQKVFRNFPPGFYKNKFYEWGLLQVREAANLPLEIVEATELPIIEIDFPEDYLNAQKNIFPLLSSDCFF